LGGGFVAQDFFGGVEAAESACQLKEVGAQEVRAELRGRSLQHGGQLQEFSREREFVFGFGHSLHIVCQITSVRI